MSEITGYELSRQWFDYSFENPELVRPIHSAIYFFAIEHCNRLGWKKKFKLPSSMVMEAIGVKSHNTYIKAFRELVEWGFFTLIQESKNQYSSNIIALSKNNKAPDKALDKALIKHDTKHIPGHRESTGAGTDSVYKQRTIEQGNNEPIKKNAGAGEFNLPSEQQKIPVPEDVEDVIRYGLQKGIPKENCEMYFEMRSRDNFIRSDMHGNEIPIRNWYKDLSLLHRKGSLEKQKNHGTHSNKSRGQKAVDFLSRS